MCTNVIQINFAIGLTNVKFNNAIAITAIEMGLILITICEATTYLLKYMIIEHLAVMAGVKGPICKRSEATL